MSHEFALLSLDPSYTDIARDTLSGVFAGLFLMALSAIGAHFHYTRSRGDRFERNFKGLKKPAKELLGVDIETEGEKPCP